MRVFLFRGRSTAGIERDARARWPDAEIHIVAEAGDRLREARDVASIPLPNDGEEIAIVVNGGPSWTMVSEVVRLTADLAYRDGAASDYSDGARGRVRLVDLQRDGAREIVI